MYNILKIGLLLLVFLFSSCGSYFNQPFTQKAARIGEFSKSTKKLLDIPKANAPLEVAVYNFSDQTGQYKPVENGSTFSTAVTQGATTILIKALEDSGWFVPIERENLSNLSTERNIIRNTKQEYIKNLNPNVPPLPPLLYAGLLLEGGIISYDTNIVTGGLGARYFGLGASSRYRQDRITVYLRAVSTSNGEILKTIYVSKTILSQALDANFFRFVKFQRLFEAETGITQNEPVQIAVKDAIERAVHDLIMEGINDKLWKSKDGEETDKKLVNSYLMEKSQEESIELYDRIMIDRPHKNSVGLTGGLTLIDGDYKTKKLSYLTRLHVNRQINKYVSVGFSAGFLELNSGVQYQGRFADFNLNGQIDLLPNDDLSPYFFTGMGTAREVKKDINTGKQEFGDTFFKMQYGLGVQYHFSPRWTLKGFVEHNVVFSDKLEGLENGRRDDFYYNLGVGLHYSFSFNKRTKTLKEL
jgi:curli production assembly/transport component CsgG